MTVRHDVACASSFPRQRPTSRQADEAVEHALAAGMLEVDLELVALDLGDVAVAELGVEDALADRDVGAAGIAEADRARPRLEHPGGAAVEGAAGRSAAPARAAAGAALDVGEWVGALGPVGAPQRFAAAHRRLLLDMRVGQLGDEARWDRRGPLAVDAAV